MSLLDLIKKIENTAKSQQGVHSVFRGDIYENWNKPDIEYISVNVAITNFTQHIIDAYDEYEVYLYCGDRLLQDNSNEYEVLTNAQRVLVKIVNSLDADEKIDIVDEVLYTNFVQSFADYVAGQYVRFNIHTPIDVNNCQYELDNPVELTINENGTYEFNGNYQITVDVPTGECEEIIKELEEQIEVLETEKTALQESLSTALNQIEIDNNTIAELEAAIEAKNALIEELQITIINLRDEIAVKQTEIERLSGELEAITAAIDMERSTSIVENGTYESEDKIGWNKVVVNVARGGECEEVIEELQTEIVRLENEIEEKNTEIINLESQISTLEGEKQALQESLAEAQNTIETLNTTISELNAVIEAKNNEIADKIAQIVALNEQIANLIETVENQAENIRALDVKNEELQHDIATKQAEIATLETEKRELQNSLTEALSQIEKDETTIAELEAAIDEKNAEITRINGELVALQARLDSITSKTITENGTYTPPVGVEGWNSVTVDVLTLGYVELTQAEYDALSVKDNNTFYIITD